MLKNTAIYIVLFILAASYSVFAEEGGSMGKQFPPKEQIRVEESWSLFKGENEGKPFMGRINEGAKNLMAHPDYSFRVGLAVPLKDPGTDGLSADKEMEELNLIEDLIASRFQTDNKAIFVLVLITSGFREFMLYAYDPEDTKKKLQEITNSVKSHKIQSYIAVDKEWQVYQQFLKQIN